MSELPRQADVLPDQSPIQPPSLWLYAALVTIGALMLGVAWIDGAKLSEMLVNLGTGLLETVTILIIVDRRLRRSEVTTLKNLPSGARLLLFLARPSERQIYRYTQSFLAHLQRRTKELASRPQMDQYAHHIDSGFVLLGAPGSGKTTWLQSMAADQATAFVANPRTRRSPVLFPVRQWLPDRTLEQALVEHMSGFSPLSRRTLRRGLRKQRFVLILDGADEASRFLSPDISNQIVSFRRSFPGVPCTVSSRPDRVTPAVDIAPVVTISPPSVEEIAAFKMRMNS